MTAVLRLAGTFGLIALSCPVQAQRTYENPTIVAPSQDPERKPNGLATTPPMGWNSWNSLACEVDEKTVRAAANDLVSSGMRDAGYTYVVIDDCWQGKRDAQGYITANPTRFPLGMKATADYVHSKGLKFGIYTDAGSMTCGKYPGSQGHEYQDAIVYARWGVDYLKYDWCYTGTRNAEEAYALMADALKAGGRNIVLSICEWGVSRPWQWAPRIGNLWRTAGDLGNRWSGVVRSSIGVIEAIDLNEPLHDYAGPGHWNDPDALIVGLGKLTPAEARAQFSLWAIMAAPLMAGNDLAVMDTATRNILLNRAVIAVDQDKLGVQGRKVRDDGDSELWVRPLSDGSRAVLLFNRGEQPAEIAFSMIEIGYRRDTRAEVRDLWAKRSQGRMATRFSATVEAHGVVMLRVTP